MNSVRIDRELGGKAIQVRVVQGHEPRHFLKIFKGKLITYIDTDASSKTKLFKIRGTCADDVRAVELPSVASSLASDDVFILQTADNVYIWNGKVFGNIICRFSL